MKDSDVKVHMIIDAELAKLLCQLDPNYRDFLMPKKEIVVELDRALYKRCDARIMCSALESIGYRHNDNDMCVLKKRTIPAYNAQSDLA